MRCGRAPGSVGMEGPGLIEQGSLGSLEDRCPKRWYSGLNDETVRERLVQIPGDGLGVQLPQTKLGKGIGIDPVEEVLQFQQGPLTLQFEFVPESIEMAKVRSKYRVLTILEPVRARFPDPLSAGT